MLRDTLSTADKLMKEEFTNKLCETKQKLLHSVRGNQITAPTTKSLKLTYILLTNRVRDPYHKLRTEFFPP